MLNPLVSNQDAAPPPEGLLPDDKSEIPHADEEEEAPQPLPPSPPKEWTESVYTFQDLQTQAHLCNWTGALQKQGLRLIDIMDVRTLTRFIRKSMWCWADDHPRRSCGGYEKPQASHFPPTAEQMGTQPAWRVRFLQQNLLAWSYYSNAHRDRRIDPTFMPMTRRWSWTTFRDLRKQNPNIVFNFPKFNFAPTATSLGLASQLHEWNR